MLRYVLAGSEDEQDFHGASDPARQHHKLDLLMT